MEGLKALVEYGVIGLLLGLSVWAIGVAVERWLCYRQVDIRQFPTLDLCETMLTKRLIAIGTVAANAPYIGLLGTVLGIMLTALACAAMELASGCRPRSWMWSSPCTTHCSWGKPA